MAILEPQETALVSEYMVELGITPLYLDKAMSFSLLVNMLNNAVSNILQALSLNTYNIGNSVPTNSVPTSKPLCHRH